MLNLFQFSRSQVTLTLVSELHTLQLVAHFVSLGLGLGFLYLLFRHKTLELFENLGKSLVLRISRTELIWIGPKSRQSRGDRLGSAVRLFPRLRSGKRFLNLRLFTNGHKALEVLVGSPVGHGSPDTAGAHQNSEPNIILTTETERGGRSYLDLGCGGGGGRTQWRLSCLR